jgi:hypothetical protein
MRLDLRGRDRREHRTTGTLLANWPACYATLAMIHLPPPIVSTATAVLSRRQRRNREHQLDENRCHYSALG